MKVTVNYDTCVASAVCADIAPEVFDVRDDGYLYLLVEEPAPELFERVRDAANECPSGAITVEE